MLSYTEIDQIKQEKDKLIKEMIEQCKQNGNINVIDTYAHTIKNLCKIISEAEEESMSGEYSGAPYMMRPDQYWSNYSGKAGRGPNAPRNSMGQYSSRGDYRAHLYEAMNNAPDSERAMIQELINRMG